MSDFTVSLKLSAFCKPCLCSMEYKGIEYLTGGELHEFECPKCHQRTYLVEEN